MRLEFLLERSEQELNGIRTLFLGSTLNGKRHIYTDCAYEEAIREKFHKANMYLEVLLEVEHRSNKTLKLLNRQVCSSKAGD